MNKNLGVKYNGKDPQKQEWQKGYAQGFQVDNVCKEDLQGDEEEG